MGKTTLFNNNWSFLKTELGTELEEAVKSSGWNKVDIPHDWLIYDTNNLYENSMGWYRKALEITKREDTCYAIRFDGIYMDSTVYVNGQFAGEWKYGYNTFEFEITDLLKDGNNEILVRVIYQSPNSRWYSGAGIYRNIYFIEKSAAHIISDSVYIRTLRDGDNWMVKASCETTACGCIRYTVLDSDMNVVASTETNSCDTTVFPVNNVKVWSLDEPNLYNFRTELVVGGEVTDSVEERIGFRTIKFDCNKGFFLNDEHVKINGMCMHHDLGALGAAFNKHALRRQFAKLKEMGCNAVRTSHNMPAVEVLEIADEMGILIDNEMFDMWRLKKTDFDYARFFDEWATRDVKNFVRRDRNHPSVIMWSVGNEIYDTQVDMEDGLKTITMLRDNTLMWDPDENAVVTFGSNFLEGDSTQVCADELKIVGYNYSERLYEAHHAKHPDWVIYGSETGSTVQSRGVYHFPYKEPILVDLDEQCSSLGNSTTSWGAKNTEACILAERDAEYSAGQFVWTGFDYIGEPTPYQTKNSYFGQIDTAGFEKDTFYIFQAEWTDYKKKPMVHIFPYWDFNEGQDIDIRITSNAPKVELFFNGKSQGTFDIDHAHGKQLLGHWVLPYSKGVIEAVAYDENGNEIARDVRKSFGDATKIVLTPDKTEVKADGEDLVFIEISMNDADGNPVMNANNRVNVEVSGAGRLLGLDNGDSTDYEPYKGTSRKLFFGKLLAIIGTKTAAGDISVRISSNGIEPSELVIKAISSEVKEGVSANTENIPSENNPEVPIRKIEIVSRRGRQFSKDLKEVELEAVLYPGNCTCKEVEWVAVNDAGVVTNLAEIEAHGTKAILRAKGDGVFNVRCYSKNNGVKVNVISQVQFVTEGLGAAFIDPYNFVSAALYHISEGELGNAQEHGVATAKNAESYIGFNNVDFGDYGTDEIEIPIFAFNQEDYRVRVWSGIPYADGSELLLDDIYNMPVIWDVYQSKTYKLRKRIKGVHTICIQTDTFVNIKGFVFTAFNKGTEQIWAAENNKIYGDEFHVEGDVVKGIGNNVSIEFENMDFGKGVNCIEICGTSYVDVNTIHIMFTAEDGSTGRQMVPFEYSEENVVKKFDISTVKGKNKVTFIFLPGSRFDFNWFRFSSYSEGK